MHYFTPSNKVATLEEVINWLTDLYGDRPLDVGVENGTEDDFGDLMNADLPFAVLGRVPDEYDSELEDKFSAYEPSTWEQAITLACEVLA